MADVQIRPITAADLQRWESGGGRWEVWDETLRQKTMVTKKHGQIAAKLLFLLMSHVLPRDLGAVYPGDVTYVVEGSKKRLIKALLPDVSFVAAAHDQQADPDDFFYFAPDLAIEILSASERPAEVAEKVKTYLQFGTRQVWVIDPDAQPLTVYGPEGASQQYPSSATLTLTEILPDFSLPLSALFGA